jgi:hypothetical protein
MLMSYQIFFGVRALIFCAKHKEAHESNKQSRETNNQQQQASNTIDESH